MLDQDKIATHKISTDTASAIEAGALIGDIKINPNKESDLDAFVVLPAGAELKPLDRPASPFRRKGIVALDSADSFIEYFHRHKIDLSTNIYGRLEPARFTALFNDHRLDDNEQRRSIAGWRDFGCAYAPKFSREYNVWYSQNAKKFEGNEEFAIWLEDNLCDVVSPTSGHLLELALNFRVNSNAAFSNPVNLTDGSTEFQFTHVVENQSAGRSGKLAIPSEISIAIPVFEGRDASVYQFDARFRYRVSGNRLSIWYELIRPHKVVETAFFDMIDKIESATSQKILYGDHRAA
jgi:uncharacterized protein YfdQ (DUF2303 family)